MAQDKDISSVSTAGLDKLFWRNFELIDNLSSLFYTQVEYGSLHEFYSNITEQNYMIILLHCKVHYRVIANMIVDLVMVKLENNKNSLLLKKKKKHSK